MSCRPCENLRSVEAGKKAAVCKVKNGIGFQNDLVKSKAERAAKIAASYDTGWDDIYPVMAERGGNREIICSKNFTNNKKTEKSK